MIEINLTRLAYEEDGTPGVLSVGAVVCGYTLELPWKNNERDISCFPEGDYSCEWRVSPSKGLRIHILNIEGRDHCMFHAGNWIRQILGCVLPGLKFLRKDGNGDKMVQSSRAALKRFEDLVPKDQDIILKVMGPHEGLR